MDNLLPHGHCVNWNESLLLLHILGDGLTSLSYKWLPILLASFVYHRRKDFPSLSGVVILFGAFITLCGGTHDLDIWNIWHTNYWFQGFWKLATGIVSVGTAFSLTQMMPMLLSMRTPEQLAAHNSDMEDIIHRLMLRQKALEAMNDPSLDLASLNTIVSDLQTLARKALK